MASIRANCRKIMCIGRNYAYVTPLVPSERTPMLMDNQRSHHRAQQHRSEAALLLPQARILDPPPRRWSRTPSQRRQPAL